MHIPFIMDSVMKILYNLKMISLQCSKIHKKRLKCSINLVKDNQSLTKVIFSLKGRIQKKHLDYHHLILNRIFHNQFGKICYGIVTMVHSAKYQSLKKEMIPLIIITNKQESRVTRSI